MSVAILLEECVAPAIIITLVVETSILQGAQCTVFLHDVSYFSEHRVLGTPNEDSWPGVTSLPDYKSAFPKWPPKDLATVVPNLESAGVDLLCKMLCLDPSRRITARSALEHEYFKDIGFVP